MAKGKPDNGSSAERPIVIVDMDGTIAEVAHRLHHIQGPGKKNWKRFFEGMDRDEPIEKVIALVRELAKQSEIVILTGRPDGYEERSIAWLKKHDVPFSRILMRRAGDHRPDYIAKEDLLKQLPIERVALAIDDRGPVCEMFRRHGIKVLELTSDWENQVVNELYQQNPE